MPWVAVLMLLSVKAPVSGSWKAPTAIATVGQDQAEHHVDGEREDAGARAAAGAAQPGGAQAPAAAGPRTATGPGAATVSVWLASG